MNIHYKLDQLTRNFLEDEAPPLASEEPQDWVAAGIVLGGLALVALLAFLRPLIA